MWILVVEALGALGLLLFIVWWTLGPTHRRERDALRKAAEDARKAATNATPRETVASDAACTVARREDR